MVKEVETKQEWHNLLKSASNDDKLVIVDFTASWCGPCRLIGPVFEQLSENPKYESLVFLKVDVDKLNEVAGACGIKAMPTFIVFKKGKPVDELMGADKSKLVALVERAANGGPYEK